MNRATRYLIRPSKLSRFVQRNAESHHSFKRLLRQLLARDSAPGARAAVAGFTKGVTG